MSLFNNKIIEKHTTTRVIPENHREVIENWIKQIDSGTFKNLNEVQVQGAFTQQVMCKLLGYTAVGEADTYTVAREYPVARGRVDLAIGHFVGEKDSTKDTVLAPFELKSAETKNLDAIMSGRHKTPVQQAFEYARDIKGAKWVLISNYVEMRLYAVSETSLVFEQFFFEDLLDPTKYAKFQLLLNADDLLSGRTEKILKESETADRDISNKLYEDYKLLRENMLSHLIADNPSYSPEALIVPAQNLLDRILFISFAEDKGLIPDTSIKKAYEYQDPYNPHPIYQNFIGLFNSVDKGNTALDIPAYNGGLFAADNELDTLVISDALCEGFKDLAEYDFDSEVSVTVLGHIFEQSIVDLEVLTESITAGDLPKPKAKSTSVSGKRKKHGVVYTPDNITQFIVANTLGTHIEEQFELLFSKYGKYKPDGTVQWRKGTKTEQRFWYAWQEKLQSIKVVDPACGSGAFMVAAFDYLYAEYEKTNEKLADLTGQRGILDLNKEILNNNLFGVDINEESIEITKLSLWLKTAERGKPLESLDANFIAGNSLGIEKPAPDNDFSWKETFPQIFTSGGFDVVLGNPPYVRMELLKEIKPWLERNYVVTSDRLDLYGYFFELGLKILKDSGLMGYISNATFFKTGSGKNLRQLISSIKIECLVDFRDIQVFEGVTTYPAILILKKEQCNALHEVKFLTVENSIPENIDLDFDLLHMTMIQSKLNKERWHFEDDKILLVRNKLNHNSETIKNCFRAPFYGIKSGCNDAFVISGEVFEKLKEEDPKSVDLIKPFLDGKDLKRWHSEPRDQYLIYIPKNEIDIDDYPAIKMWLTQFRTRLEKRATKQNWYELQQAQLAYKPFMERTKILYPDITDSPKFHRSIAGEFCSNTGYFLPIESEGVCAYLNSKVVWFFLKGHCDFVRGGFLRLFTQNIQDIPIPKSYFEHEDRFAELERNLSSLSNKCFQLEYGFKRRLVDLDVEGSFKLNKKLDSWWELDFAGLQKEVKKAFKGVIPLAERNDWQDYFESEQKRREDIHREITKLEKQLNQEVYALFDLTDDEIALIETEVLN